MTEPRQDLKATCETCRNGYRCIREAGHKGGHFWPGPKPQTKNHEQRGTMEKQR